MEEWLSFESSRAAPETATVLPHLDWGTHHITPNQWQNRERARGGLAESRTNRAVDTHQGLNREDRIKKKL